MPELTEIQAERYIRRRLQEKKWSSDDIEQIMNMLNSLDGVWSYGTTRVIQDLEQIYAEMDADNVPEGRAERYIRRGLREQNWSSNVAEFVVEAVANLDGYRSEGSARAIRDLHTIYKELIRKYGEPPDRDW